MRERERQTERERERQRESGYVHNGVDRGRKLSGAGVSSINALWSFFILIHILIGEIVMKNGHYRTFQYSSLNVKFYRMSLLYQRPVRLLVCVSIRQVSSRVRTGQSRIHIELIQEMLKEICATGS